ncbi:Tetratricopeptide repeat protein [Rosistilla ulvae]|uniref:Tetratricopeptide repeat protein n=1 Tax=Rosistilla ulvae TaxID=1930277 RepID=A0A517M0F6_9BACT|nr:tetratricopeptide repeat protein [Rosistilla ulvae]QDS88361.1 Tetratricopeptide repeat protein [Rosistilla ulvae]
MNSATIESTQKRNERSVRWEVDLRFLAKTLVVAAVAAAICGGIYWVRSSKLSESIQAKADTAAESQDWDQQIRWLEQLRILQPSDTQLAIQLARAADKSADSNDLEPVERRSRNDRAIRHLRSAVIALDESPGEERTVLERKLIARLLQYGPRYVNETQNRIIELSAPQDDPEMLLGLAQTRLMLSQGQAGKVKLDPDKFNRETGFWQWLAQQPLGSVVYTAWTANRDEISLAAALLELCTTKPEGAFAEADGSEKPKQIGDEVLANLSQKRDDGHAIWTVYSHLQSTQPDQAAKLLAEADDAALQRLKSLAAENENEPTQSDLSRNPFWDFQIVYQAAAAKLRDDPTPETRSGAAETLDALIALESLPVAPQAIEAVYLTRGQLFWDAQQREKAWELWSAGIERLEDASLDLHVAQARTSVAAGTVADAQQAVDKLAAITNRLTLALSGSTGTTLSAGQRKDRENALDAARWVAIYLNGQLALRQKQTVNAIAYLKKAVDSQAPAAANDRVGALALLGSAYEQAKSWDLAAAAFEQASNQMPAVMQYRVAAARAWGKAGNSDRSIDQWRGTNVNSAAILLEQAQAMIRQQTKRTASERDYGASMKTLEKAKLAINKMDDDQPEERRRLTVQMEILALAMPAAEDGSHKLEPQERLEQLLKQYPDSPELQSVAVISLASSNNLQQSRQHLDDLGRLAGEDSLLFCQTKASVLAMQGKAELAIETLTQHASKTPTDAVTCLTQGADIALSNSLQQRGFDLLRRVVAIAPTPDLIYRLHSLALSQPPSDTADATTETPSDDAQRSAEHWENMLRDDEGSSGAWWRLAVASRLLHEYDRAKPNDPQRDALLKQANQLQREIAVLRPRWALGISLEGLIAARNGETIRAIDALRRGIDGGDQRVSSLLLLVSQLTTANRIDEAEAAFQGFERLKKANSTVAQLAIAIAEMKGDFRQGLDLARASAERNPRETKTWLLLAQTASAAAKSTDEPQARKALIAEASEALDRALVESGDSSLAVYQLRVQFQNAFFGTPEVTRELQQAANSKITEPTRSLFVGLTYLKLNDLPAAFAALTKAYRIKPESPECLIALSDYYKAAKNDAKSIEMLETALQFRPDHVEVRNRLALAIALRDGGEVPWKRLDALLGSEQTLSAKNKLLHALILINRGDEQRQQQADKILRDVIRNDKDNHDDAVRMLAALERRRWAIATESGDTRQASRPFAESRRLYTILVRRTDPLPLDIYRFADLLLAAEQTSEIDALADQLDKMADGGAMALDIRLRLARHQGDEKKAAQLAASWTQQMIGSEGTPQASAWETAGRTLSRLGFHEQALDWLQQAFEEDPKYLRPYVIALARGRKFDIALDVCQTEFEKTMRGETLALIADLIVLSGNTVTVPIEIEGYLDDAIHRYKSVAPVMESVATLRLSQQRYAEAVALYERAEKLAPQNVRILNNLAMALSEVQGRFGDALPRIRKAIDLYGRSPELLDTLGLVLLRNDQIDEAVVTLREATGSSPEPHYRFHLVMALLRSGDRVAARAQWAQLDIRAIKSAVLTPAETRDLEAIQEEFGRRKAS